MTTRGCGSTGQKNPYAVWQQAMERGGRSRNKWEVCQRFYGQKVRMTFDITGAVLIPLRRYGAAPFGYAFSFLACVFHVFLHASIEQIKCSCYNTENQTERIR